MASGISLTNGKKYNVMSVEEGWLRIVDDTDDNCLFSPEEFEVVEE